MLARISEGEVRIFLQRDGLPTRCQHRLATHGEWLFLPKNDSVEAETGDWAWDGWGYGGGGCLPRVSGETRGALGEPRLPPEPGGSRLGLTTWNPFFCPSSLAACKIDHLPVHPGPPHQYPESHREHL